MPKDLGNWDFDAPTFYDFANPPNKEFCNGWFNTFNHPGHENPNKDFVVLYRRKKKVVPSTSNHHSENTFIYNSSSKYKTVPSRANHRQNAAPILSAEEKITHKQPRLLKKTTDDYTGKSGQCNGGKPKNPHIRQALPGGSSSERSLDEVRRRSGNKENSESRNHPSTIRNDHYSAGSNGKRKITTENDNRRKSGEKENDRPRFNPTTIGNSHFAKTGGNEICGTTIHKNAESGEVKIKDSKNNINTISKNSFPTTRGNINRRSAEGEARTRDEVVKGNKPNYHTTATRNIHSGDTGGKGTWKTGRKSVDDDYHMMDLKTRQPTSGGVPGGFTDFNGNKRRSGEKANQYSESGILSSGPRKIRTEDCRDSNDRNETKHVKLIELTKEELENYYDFGDESSDSDLDVPLDISSEDDCNDYGGVNDNLNSHDSSNLRFDQDSVQTKDEMESNSLRNRRNQHNNYNYSQTNKNTSIDDKYAFNHALNSSTTNNDNTTANDSIINTSDDNIRSFDSGRLVLHCQKQNNDDSSEDEKVEKGLYERDRSDDDGDSSDDQNSTLKIYLARYNQQFERKDDDNSDEQDFVMDNYNIINNINDDYESDSSDDDDDDGYAKRLALYNEMIQKKSNLPSDCDSDSDIDDGSSIHNNSRMDTNNSSSFPASRAQNLLPKIRTCNELDNSDKLKSYSDRIYQPICETAAQSEVYNGVAGDSKKNVYTMGKTFQGLSLVGGEKLPSANRNGYSDGTNLVVTRKPLPHSRREVVLDRKLNPNIDSNVHAINPARVRKGSDWADANSRLVRQYSDKTDTTVISDSKSNLNRNGSKLTGSVNRHQLPPNQSEKIVHSSSVGKEVLYSSSQDYRRGQQHKQQDYNTNCISGSSSSLSKLSHVSSSISNNSNTNAHNFTDKHNAISYSDKNYIHNLTSNTNTCPITLTKNGINELRQRDSTLQYTNKYNNMNNGTSNNNNNSNSNNNSKNNVNINNNNNNNNNNNIDNYYHNSAPRSSERGFNHAIAMTTTSTNPKCKSITDKSSQAYSPIKSITQQNKQRRSGENSGLSVFSQPGNTNGELRDKQGEQAQSQVKGPGRSLPPGVTQMKGRIPEAVRSKYDRPVLTNSNMSQSENFKINEKQPSKKLDSINNNNNGYGGGGNGNNNYNDKCHTLERNVIHKTVDINSRNVNISKKRENRNTGVTGQASIAFCKRPSAK